MPSAERLEWLLLKRTNVLALCYLESADQYVSELARKLKSNFSSVNRLLKQLESAGLVRFQRKAGKKYVMLTSNGIQIRQQVLKLLELLGSKPTPELESQEYPRLRKLEQELSDLKLKLTKLESQVGILDQPLEKLALKLQQISTELNSPELTKSELGSLLRRLGPCIRDLRKYLDLDPQRARSLLVRAEQLSQLARSKLKQLSS